MQKELILFRKTWLKKKKKCNVTKGIIKYDSDSLYPNLDTYHTPSSSGLKSLIIKSSFK